MKNSPILGKVDVLLEINEKIPHWRDLIVGQKGYTAQQSLRKTESQFILWFSNVYNQTLCPQT